MPTNAAYQYIINTLSKQSDSKELEQLLDALLTEKEQLELANRIRIFSLLQEGLPQREISDKLGVGIATVSRGAKAYRQLNVDKLLPNLSKEL